MLQNEAEETFLSYVFSSEHSGLCFVIQNNPCQIYFVALLLTVISYRPSWRIKQRNLNCVFTFQVSPIERSLLIGIKIRFHWYLLLPRSVIFSIFLLKVMNLIRVIWIRLARLVKERDFVLVFSKRSQGF